MGRSGAWLAPPVSPCAAIITCLQPGLPSFSRLQLGFNHEPLGSTDSKQPAFAVDPDCLTSGGKEPVLGLARAVKGLTGSNAVQTMNSHSALSLTLWYVIFHSPAKYVRAMTAESSQPLAID